MRAIVLTLVAFTACGKGDVSVTATARVVHDTTVELTVKTAPGAQVEIDGAKPVTADGSGTATIQIDPPPPTRRPDDAQVFWVVAHDSGREGKVRVEVKVPRLECRWIAEQHEHVIDCTAGRRCTGTVPATLAATFTAIDAGTKVELGGAKGTATAAGLALTVDPVPLLGGASLAAGARIAMPLAITFADGARLATACSFDGAALAFLLADVLVGADTHPVTFGADDTAVTRPRAIYDVDRRAVIGAAATPKEIDLVALTGESRRKTTCGTYGSEVGQLPVDHVLVDGTVRIVDRRTGKVRASKKFPAAVEPCPQAIEQGRAFISSYSVGDATAWIAAQIK